MDVSLNAGLTFSPPWLGPPQPTTIRTKRPNLLILHPGILPLPLPFCSGPYFIWKVCWDCHNDPPLVWWWNVLLLLFLCKVSSTSPLCKTGPIVIASFYGDGSFLQLDPSTLPQWSQWWPLHWWWNLECLFEWPKKSRNIKIKRCEKGKTFCMITSATEVLPLECILCDLQMSNGCVGHIVWVRSGLLRYYVGTQKPARDHMSTHTICHAGGEGSRPAPGEDILKQKAEELTSLSKKTTE